MTFTDADLRNEIVAYLGAVVDDYDVQAIADELQRCFGTVSIDDIDHSDFITIVARYDITGDVQ